MFTRLCVGALALIALLFSGTESLAQVRFVRVPAGTVLQVVLDTDVHTAALRPGDVIPTTLEKDVVLPGGETLRAGTFVLGGVGSMNTDTLFGKGLMSISFDRMQLRNGNNFPIETRILSGVCRGKEILVRPDPDHLFKRGARVRLELHTAAQVAVSGQYM